MNSYGLTTPDAAVYLGVDKVLSLKPHQFRDLKDKLANEKSSGVMMVLVTIHTVVSTIVETGRGLTCQNHFQQSSAPR